MGFFSFFKVFGSFASKIESTLTKILGGAATWERVASTTLTFVGPLVGTVVSLSAGPLVGAEVASRFAGIQNDLVAAKHLIEAVGPHPSVRSLLAAAAGELERLATEGHIAHPDALKFSLIITNELDALIEAWPKPAGQIVSVPAPAQNGEPVYEAAALPEATTSTLTVESHSIDTVTETHPVEVEAETETPLLPHLQAQSDAAKS